MKIKGKRTQQHNLIKKIKNKKRAFSGVVWFDWSCLWLFGAFDGGHGHNTKYQAIFTIHQIHTMLCSFQAQFKSATAVQ